MSVGILAAIVFSVVLKTPTYAATGYIATPSVAQASIKAITSCSKYNTEVAKQTILTYIKRIPANRRAIPLRNYMRMIQAWGKICSKTGTKITLAASSQITGNTIMQSGFSFEITNRELISQMAPSIANTLESSLQTYATTFVTTVQDMVTKHIFTNEDAKTLQHHIILGITGDCTQIVAGQTLVQQWLTNTGAIAKVDLLSITFNIPVCSISTRPTPAAVISHELGHYYYYFHDNGDSFSRICRTNINGKEVRSCMPHSFVSSYAMTNGDEDYAETFSYRYRSLFETPLDYQLSLKQQFFQNHFGNK